MSSKVSVNLDEFATDEATLNSIIAELLKPNPQFWIDRIKKQVNLATFRFAFRPLFVDNKYQLPLTQPSHWHIVLHENPKHHHSIGGHDLVYVSYTWSTHILSDYESPGISEPQLGNIGGQWVEPFILPADPYNLIQRTGYACMDEVGNSGFSNGKRGFCIQSTGRQANAEWSPTWSPFYSCTYQGNSPGWTVRICESSVVLNTGVACDYDTALGNEVIKPSSEHVIQFICPSYRDPLEPGGLYSIYTAPIMEQLVHAEVTITCVQNN
ncbi:unnamed protein product [Rotaria sp. Silwood2]|nr:unnamed protein product [Rotaria sp. Silwood2]CAF4447321.1 unnamed protein product [Rotaria sp. Silwood2]